MHAHFVGGLSPHDSNVRVTVCSRGTSRKKISVGPDRELNPGPPRMKEP